MNSTTGLAFKIQEMAQRIKTLREIVGISTAEMAEKTGVSEQEYVDCELGKNDLNFAFLYRCALALGVVGGCILLTRVATYERVETYDAAFASVGYSLHILAVARLEANGRSGGDVQMHSEGRLAVEIQKSVYLEEVIVRSDLNRSIARIADGKTHRIASYVILHGLLAQHRAANFRLLLGRISLLVGIERSCLIYLLHRRLIL